MGSRVSMAHYSCCSRYYIFFAIQGCALITCLAFSHVNNRLLLKSNCRHLSIIPTTIMYKVTLIYSKAVHNGPASKYRSWFLWIVAHMKNKWSLSNTMSQGYIVITENIWPFYCEVILYWTKVRFIFNSSSPSAAYMHQWIESAFVQTFF